MNSRTGKFLNAIAIGFIVLVLASLVLFSGRYYCHEPLMEQMPWDWKKVTICPSGLLSGEGSPNQTKDVLTYADAGISNDPNTKLSAVQFELNDFFIRMGAIGISQRYIPGAAAGSFIPKADFITITMTKMITCYLTSTAARLFIVMHIQQKGRTGKILLEQNFISQDQMVFPRRPRLH